MPETTLDPTATDDLRSQLEGTLVMPEDDGYDDARKTANGMFDDKRPAAVAQCASDMAAMKLSSSGCRHYVAGSDKARLQWKLEEEFKSRFVAENAAAVKAHA